MGKQAAASFWHRYVTGKINIFLYLMSGGVFAYLIHSYIHTHYYPLAKTFLYFILPCLFSLISVALLTPITISLARSFSIIDHAKDHKFKKPTPLLGGVSIYLAFLFVAWLHRPWTPEMTSIILGGSVILILGTIDDIYPLSSTIRLFGQLVASCMVMSSGLIVSFMPDTLWGNYFAFLITLVWILGIINATNFADGADGLAAGFTLIASGFFFLITFYLHEYSISLLAVIVCGCTLGFLIFNFKPAKIYLGDGGSTFLGFLLASFALYGDWSARGPIIALGIPTLILGVLIFDMIYITISRIRNGHVRSFKEWLDYRGRDHFHHRLINMGFKEEYAVVFIYIICIILGLSASILANTREIFPVIILLVQATLIFVCVIMLMLVGRQITEKK